MRGLPFDYATRNLGRSPGRLAGALVGSTLVTLLVIASASFIRGMGASLDPPAGNSNVIFLGAGSEESVERSEIRMQAADVVGTISGLRTRLGQPFISPEVHIGLAVRTDPTEPEGRLTPLRGVRPSAFLVHSEVQITEGRAPVAGANELLVGGLVSGQLGVPDARLGLGEVLHIDGREWRIVGRMRAPRTVIDAEIWIPLTDLQVIAQRDNLSCVIATLVPGEADITDAEILAAQRLDLELAVMTESEYYATLSRFYAPVRAMVLATALLVALGGILGGLNTMVAAFASRVREVGTLQVIGYPRRAIILSFLQESWIISSCGALVAGALGWAVLDGVAVRFSMGAFGLIVDAPVLAIGVGAGLGLGLLGALPPTIHCLRLPVGQALKS